MATATYLSFKEAEKASAQFILSPEYCVDLAFVYQTVYDATKDTNNITFEDRNKPDVIDSHAYKIARKIKDDLDFLNINRNKITHRVTDETIKEIKQTACDIIRARYTGTDYTNDPDQIRLLIGQNAICSVAKQYGIG